MASPQVWFITGCSSGFGMAIARRLLQENKRVIATARDPRTLEPLQVQGARCMQLDVTASPEELTAKVAEAEQIYGSVDVVVNNAGYAQLGTLEDTSHETVLRQFNTNFFGAVNLTRAFLPFFRARKAGTVVMMTSVDAWVGRAGFGAYTASKHALQGFTECIRQEVMPFNVRVLMVEPGTFRTSAITRSNLKISSSNILEYEDLYTELNAFPDAHGSEPGDPNKLAKHLIALVTREDPFGTGVLPTQLPMGTDSWEEIRGRCVEMLKVLDEWKDVICSTDFQ